MRVAQFVFSLLLTILASSPPLNSQQRLPAPTRDPQALDLLSKCSFTMGSPGEATTVYATGNVLSTHLNEAPVQLTLKSKSSDKLRWDLNSSSAQETVTMQAGTGKATRDGSTTLMAPWQTMYSRPEHFPALLCISEVQRPNMEIVYVGLEPVGQTLAHHIKISAMGRGKSARADAADRVISEFHIFLDAQSFVVLKTKRFAFSPDAIENRSDYETYYAKYAAVNGVLMPFAITNFLAGQKLQDIVLDSIQLNVPVSDAEFN